MKDAIYLVLDMMNDLVHADGPNGKAAYGDQVRKRDLINRTRTAVEKARNADIQIGFVRVGFSPDYRECPPNSPIFSLAKRNGLFKLGSWGTEVHPDLGWQEGDFDVVKHRVSPFYATSLEAILRAHDIKRIYCSGVSTNAVVQAAVRDGHDRDYAVTVLADCCCAPTDEEHEQALQGLKRFCHITTSDDVVFE
jgi:nicotinamidase-related amidase